MLKGSPSLFSDDGGDSKGNSGILTDYSSQSLRASQSLRSLSPETRRIEGLAVDVDDGGAQDSDKRLRLPAITKTAWTPGSSKRVNFTETEAAMKTPPIQATQSPSMRSSKPPASPARQQTSIASVSMNQSTSSVMDDSLESGSLGMACISALLCR